MTDQPPNIIGPIASLAAVGVMAYGAKTLIDVMKEKALEDKKKKKPLYQEPHQRGDRIDASINKMLGR